MKRKLNIKLNRQKTIRTVIMTAVVFSLVSVPVFATGDTTKITTGLDTFKTLFFSIIAGIGAITAGKGIMDTSQGYQQQDSSGMNAGIKEIISGGLMALVSTLVALFI